MKKLLPFLLIILILIFGYLAYSYISKYQAQTVNENNTHLGFIHFVNSEKSTLEFDDAVWLNGKAGEDAAIKSGICTEETRSECLPNDYFIENTIKENKTLHVSKDTKVFMKTWNAGDLGIMDREINFEQFAELINDSNAHWSKLPYYVTIQKGNSTRIGEIYIP